MAGLYRRLPSSEAEVDHLIAVQQTYGSVPGDVTPPTKVDGEAGDEIHHAVVAAGRENLYDVVRPLESYEGYYRFDPSATWTEEEERKVVFKADCLLLSWVCLMFFSLQLDRGNLSNALTDNLLPDLGLTTQDYNNGNTIQILCFLAAEFPVQLLTKRFGFRRVLPILMICWGTVSWAQSWMHDRASFYICRGLIGVFEGGFVPGAILFMTYFYTSKELSPRLACLWSSLNFARIMSSLLAAVILQMRGVSGKPGWFWLFIIEGALTTLMGVASFFYLPNSPVCTTGVFFQKPWFSEREEVIMINRLLRDDPAKGLTELKEPAKWDDIWDAWTDKSMWGFYLIGLVAYIAATPVSGYLSLTLKRIGFSTFDSNMLSIPGAVLQIFLMMGLAKSSEYFNERGIHCALGEFWMLPLLAALLALPSGGRLWGRFTLTTLVTGYPYFHPIVAAWISENSFSVKKRTITAATYNVVVQVGSVIGSQIYRTSDAPYYYTGNTVCLAIGALSVLVILAQKSYLQHVNTQKTKVWAAMSLEDRAKYQENQEEREKDGNRRLDFLFKL